MLSLCLVVIAAPAFAGAMGTKEFCAAFEAPSGPEFARCDPAKDKGNPAYATALEAAQRNEHQCLELLNSALSTKHLRMDPSGARRCAEARTAYLKDPSRSKQLFMTYTAACSQAFTGLIAKGGACESAFDCASGLACVGPDGGAPGKCVPPLKKGAACSSDTVNASAFADFFSAQRSVCGPGAHCANVCAADLGMGARCSGSDPAECGPGLACVKNKCAAPQLAAAPACGGKK